MLEEKKKKQNSVFCYGSCYPQAFLACFRYKFRLYVARKYNILLHHVRKYHISSLLLISNLQNHLVGAYQKICH